MVQEVFWTEERKAILRQYWEKKSNSEIADIVGDGATRCSVSGIAHRMGLRKKEIVPRDKMPKGKRRVSREEKKLRKMPKPPNLIVKGTDVSPLLDSILEVTGKTCLYPYGDRQFKFCGRPRQFGSYCAEHAFLCYQPARPSNRILESSKQMFRPRYR